MKLWLQVIDSLSYLCLILARTSVAPVASVAASAETATVIPVTWAATSVTCSASAVAWPASVIAPRACNQEEQT